MNIKNSLLIDKINQAIISHNESAKDEQIELITNGEISIEDLKKLSFLHIDISDISEEKEKFFEELGSCLENMNLKDLSLYSFSINEPLQIDVNFLSKVNKELEMLQISGIDLNNVNSNIFNQFKNLKVLGLGNNNITDFEILSEIGENTAIDIGDNTLDNVSINEIINELNKHHGKMAFNEHPFLNSIVFALEDKQIDLSNPAIPKNRMEEMLQFCKDYKIVPYIKIEDYQKVNNELKIPSNISISRTNDISTEFLINHPEIKEIQIIDEENRCDSEQEQPYTREEFIKIKQEIDKITEQVEIPDIKDSDREKKIFMQVYLILGKKIEYNHYAVSDEGKKDKQLQVTCRNLRDGLLKGEAVCAGYADILKNVLGEFGIKAQYIGRNPEEMEKYAERMGYQDKVKMDEALGFEKTGIDEFVKNYGYQDDHGHAWNSVILDGKKYLCDLTWDADNIKLEHFPLAYCCPSLDEFNSVGIGEITHDMFEITEEGEIAEFSSEDQLRFLGFSEEEIEKILNPSLEDFEALLEEYESKKKLEACAVGLSTEIKASDFDGIDKAFNDREKEEQKGHDK